MPKPVLLVIAGCNGSGKSTFSKPLSPDNFTPFDYDFQFLRFYNSLMDSDIREDMAHRMAFNELENQIKKAIDNKSSFCYETNFNSTPLHWPELFKKMDMICILFSFVLIQFKRLKKELPFV